MLKPFKFNVQAVVIECDGTGGIVGERPGDILTIYGTDALAEWARTFAERLAEVNGALLVRIGTDGKIEYGVDYDPDEAARSFWEAMARHAPIAAH